MIELLEERLAALIPGEDTLSEAMRYSLLSKGKRLRPLFTLHVVQALNPSRFEQAMQAALAIECIHTYSLIHDDLPCMDDDDIRRGKPSLHKVFGEDIALLAGDALLTLAFELLASLGKATIIQKLAQLIGHRGMVLGQMLDISLETFSKEDIFRLFEYKTANLFVAALEIGGIIATEDKKIHEQLVAYGKLFGIAFQIADDIEDFHAGKEEKIAMMVGIEQLSLWHKELKTAMQQLELPIPFLCLR